MKKKERSGEKRKKEKYNKRKRRKEGTEDEMKGKNAEARINRLKRIKMRMNSK